MAWTLRALLPIGLGHAASIALVAAAEVFGLSLDRSALLAVAGGLLLVAAAVHLRRRAAPREPAGHIALTLWSFMFATAHGAGLMLVPALMPLCLTATSTRPITGSGSLLLALAALGVHSAAMLVVTGAVAIGASAGLAVLRRCLRTFLTADVAFRRRIPLSLTSSR